MPPSEVKWLKLLDMDVNDLMISIDGKNEYSVWDVGKWLYMLIIIVYLF